MSANKDFSQMKAAKLIDRENPGSESSSRGIAFQAPWSKFLRSSTGELEFQSGEEICVNSLTCLWE